MIERELGWKPTVSLAEGIENTLAFYRKNSAEYWND
jgi:nucleoside-diphosphate-sugar epimerase